MSSESESPYTYRVQWSEKDNAWLGRCAEFPKLTCRHADRHAALDGIFELVAAALEELQEMEESPPVPFSQRMYSGELRLRMPPALHRRLAIEAAEDFTSINAVILDYLLH